MDVHSEALHASAVPVDSTPSDSTPYTKEYIDPGFLQNAAELDRIYNEIDKLYHQFAKACSLSDCAYWMLYALVQNQGTMPLRDLSDLWSYSKQTVNSALKSLETKELVAISYAEGSRKNKDVALTTTGKHFCDQYITPALHAELRAFSALTSDERLQLMSLTRRYTNALAKEIKETLTETQRSLSE